MYVRVCIRSVQIKSLSVMLPYPPSQNLIDPISFSSLTLTLSYPVLLFLLSLIPRYSTFPYFPSPLSPSCLPGITHSPSCFSCIPGITPPPPPALPASLASPVYPVCYNITTGTDLEEWIQELLFTMQDSIETHVEAAMMGL